MKIILTILCVWMLGKAAVAQTCNGSVGDPLVNITFGSGSNNIGLPLPPETTTLNYYSFGCPNDGQYTITNYTSSCFQNAWHTLKDHTGNANGYFMLINASYDPSDFYVQTIDGLCAGTTFQFAVWMVNMCNFTSAISPRIILTIEKTDGTVLSKYNTGDIPVSTTAPEWKQYGFNFTMPVGVSTVVLRMHNDAPGGVGNDISLDDITFRPIGPKVTVNASGLSGDSVLLCAKDNQSLIFHSSIEKCYFTTRYQWQSSMDNGITWTDIPGAQSADYTRMPTAAGIYLYRLTVAQAENIGSSICRVASNQFKVIVYKDNASTIIINKPPGAVCEDASVTFTATTTFAGSTPSFQWLINNQPVADGNDSVYTIANLSPGDKIVCNFASSLACNDPQVSGAVPVTILKKARDTLIRSVCEGEGYEGYTVSGIYNDAFPGSNGCDSIRTLNLTVYPKEHTNFDTSICYGTSYLGLTKDGTYDFTYQSIHGCDSVRTFSIRVLPDINTKPHLDTILCSGDVITYSPGLFSSYQWQDGSTDSIYNIRHGGSYSVTVSNKCGMATKTVTVNEHVCIVDFPTAFTPNGDGRNDVFRVVNGYDISTYHFVVFNRWGQKIFETANPAEGWNGIVKGRYADNGVYLWFCDYTYHSQPSDKMSIKGTVMLLR